MSVLYLKKLDNPKELIRPSGGVILLFISLRGILALLEMFGVGDGEEIRESGKESSALFYVLALHGTCLEKVKRLFAVDLASFMAGLMAWIRLEPLLPA